MSQSSEIVELENRLKQLNSMISNKESFKESFSEDQEVEKLEARLAELDNHIANKEKIGNKNSKPLSLIPDSDFDFVRGAAKSVGGLMDLARKSIPDDAIQNQNLDLLSGGTLTPAQIEQLKVDTNQPRQLTGSVEQEALKEVNQLAGRDTTPTTIGGKFREKVGEFASIPVGLNAVPAIAAVSTGLRELGLDESYSDLIAAIGTPNIKALSKLPGKVLKKLGDYIGTIGSKEYREAGNVEKAAKFLQEKVGENNIPKVIENIENYETPFKGNIVEGEAAYKPLTADIADNVGLSQYHRAKAENIPDIGQRRQTNAEVLQREIDKLASKEVTPQISQEFAAGERESYKSRLDLENRFFEGAEDLASKQFEKTAKIDEAGKITQDYLANRVSGIEKEAQKKASPLYEAAKEKSLNGRPGSTFDYIDEQMKEWSRASDINRDMRKAKIALENSASSSAAEKKSLIDSIKKKHKKDPEMMDIALKAIEKVSHGTYNAGKLDKAKREISAILESVPYNEKERRRTLSNVLEKLDKDMESIPEIFEARKVYREVMGPANAIVENPVLGNLINKNSGFTRPFTVTHAEIPDRVIKGSKSIEGAKALMSEAAGAGTKEHKQMLETLKSYINSDILANFVESNGRVSPDKFKSWSKSNPGAFILYPELKTKLKNLENAQVHVNRVIKQNEELLANFYSNSMEKILGSKFKGTNSDKIAGKILDSTNSEAVMEEAMELLSKDKTGNASEGLRRGIVDHLKNKFKSDKFTFATMNDYLKKNRKALSKAFTSEQIEVLEKSNDILKDIAKMEGAGKGSNSDSIPKLMENLAERSGGKASEALFGVKLPSWVGSILGTIDKISDLGKLKYLENALLEPEYAKLLLSKDTKIKKNFFDSLKNKEDFGKWLRDSDGPFKAVAETFKDIGKNFSITSQNVGKVILNDDL